jgi:hypothetical protein
MENNEGVLLNIPDVIDFKQPKKVGEFMVSKMNFTSKKIIIQLPKMKMDNIVNNKIHFKN